MDQSLRKLCLKSVCWLILLLQKTYQSCFTEHNMQTLVVRKLLQFIYLTVYRHPKSSSSLPEEITYSSAHLMPTNTHQHHFSGSIPGLFQKAIGNTLFASIPTLLLFAWHVSALWTVNLSMHGLLLFVYVLSGLKALSALFLKLSAEGIVVSTTQTSVIMSNRITRGRLMKSVCPFSSIIMKVFLFPVQ